jgi:hypothetical protein
VSGRWGKRTSRAPRYSSGAGGAVFSRRAYMWTSRSYAPSRIRRRGAPLSLVTRGPGTLSESCGCGTLDCRPRTLCHRRSGRRPRRRWRRADRGPLPTRAAPRIAARFLGARFSTPSALSAPGDREICVEDVDGAALVGASLVSSPSASCSDVDGANPEIWLEPEAICWPPADRRLAILPNVEPWISRSRGAV